MVSSPYRNRVFSPTRPYTRLNPIRREPCPQQRSFTQSLRWHTRPRSRVRVPKGKSSKQWKNQRRFSIRTSLTRTRQLPTYAPSSKLWVSVRQNLRKSDSYIYIITIDYSHSLLTVIRIAIVIGIHSQSYMFEIEYVFTILCISTVIRLWL